MLTTTKGETMTTDKPELPFAFRRPVTPPALQADQLPAFDAPRPTAKAVTPTGLLCAAGFVVLAPVAAILCIVAFPLLPVLALCAVTVAILLAILK